MTETTDPTGPWPAHRLRALLAGDDALVAAAAASADPTALAAAALAAVGDPAALVERAAAVAHTAPDRRGVAVVAAYLRGERDRARLLAHDHLVDHPDSPLVAHVARLLA